MPGDDDDGDADKPRRRRKRKPAAAIPQHLPLLIDRRLCAALLSVGERTFDRLVATKKFPEPDVRASAKFIRWRRETVLTAVEQMAAEGMETAAR